MVVAGASCCLFAAAPSMCERNHPKMTRLLATITTRLHTRERGATAVEYGLLVALIAAVIVAVVLILGRQVSQPREGQVSLPRHQASALVGALGPAAATMVR